MSHAELVELARKWLWNHKHTVIITELKTYGCREIPDAIGWKHSDSHSTLIECKTSKSDFLNDPKKSKKYYPEYQIGDYRYYLAPKDLISPDELPENWGLIEVVNGNPIVKTQAGKQDAYKSGEVSLLLSGMKRLGKSPLSDITIKCYRDPVAQPTLSIQEIGGK